MEKTSSFAGKVYECPTGGVSPHRSSDGVSAAGTVVVSRLKMGEMEEADIDYISTEKTSHKVEKKFRAERQKQESACFFRSLVLMQGLDRHCSSPPMRLNKLRKANQDLVCVCVCENTLSTWSNRAVAGLTSQ